MRITLDLDDLLARGLLAPAEAERLKGLAVRDASALGSNIFLAFGAVTLTLGLGVLVPTAQTAIVLGLALFGAGFALRLGRQARWDLFAQVAIVIGSLSVTGGLWVLTNGAVEMLALLSIGLVGAAVAARSGLLASLSVLTLAAALGSGTVYFMASYGIWVSRPALTIVVLSAATLALYLAAQRLPAAYERLALIAARTAILLVNVAFLVGSLFGDGKWHLDRVVFVIGWALALLAIALWAITANRRWVVNVAAVFGALHFYTQWFEQMGLSALSLLGGGAILVVLGAVLRWYNQRAGRTVIKP